MKQGVYITKEQEKFIKGYYYCKVGHDYVKLTSNPIKAFNQASELMDMFDKHFWIYQSMGYDIKGVAVWSQPCNDSMMNNDAIFYGWN